MQRPGRDLFHLLSGAGERSTGWLGAGGVGAAVGKLATLLSDAPPPFNIHDSSGEGAEQRQVPLLRFSVIHLVDTLL